MADISAEFVTLVRVMIQDTDSVLYTDDRIKELIATAARFVTQEVVFDITYTVNITNKTISPDPFVEDDQSFINLVSLKAACILDVSTLRTEARKDGVKITQDKSTIITTGRMAGFKTVLEKGWCNLYAEAKDEYIDGVNCIAGEAIMTPFKSIDGFPTW